MGKGQDWSNNLYIEECIAFIFYGTHIRHFMSHIRHWRIQVEKNISVSLIIVSLHIMINKLVAKGISLSRFLIIVWNLFLSNDDEIYLFKTHSNSDSIHRTCSKNCIWINKQPSIFLHTYFIWFNRCLLRDKNNI